MKPLVPPQRTAALPCYCAAKAALLLCGAVYTAGTLLGAMYGRAHNAFVRGASPAEKSGTKSRCPGVAEEWSRCLAVALPPRMSLRACPAIHDCALPRMSLRA